MRLALLLLALATCAALPARAQQTGPGPAHPSRDAGWTSFGAGFWSHPYDVSGFLSLNYGRERFAQLLVNGTSHFCISSSCAGVAVIGLGGGRSWVDRSARAAVSGGLAAGSHTARAGGPSHPSAGAYANVQLAVTPVKEVGVGLDLFAQTYGTDGLLGRPRVAYGLRVLFVIEGNK